VDGGCGGTVVGGGDRTVVDGGDVAVGDVEVGDVAGGTVAGAVVELAGSVAPSWEVVVGLGEPQPTRPKRDMRVSAGQ
jgi:hypothetical protein